MSEQPHALSRPYSFVFKDLGVTLVESGFTIMGCDQGILQDVRSSG